MAFIAIFSLAAARPTAAQTAEPTATPPNQLKRIEVTAPKRKPARRAAPGTQLAPLPAPAPTAGNGKGPNTTPLNTNVIAESASRLGLTVRETPATVEVVDQQTMREQGYRTTAETVNGAVGVLSVDAAGAPAGFSMRGFSFGEVNVLYNGISIGPQSITSRWMDTANLAQVEFLKGPSSLMTGLNAIGGSVNYVTRQPISGPIQNELDLSLDSLGTVRSHFGSGGSSAVKGLDYRFDVIGTRLNGFIDDVNRNLTGVSGQLNYRVTDYFKTFVAVEYKKDSGHAYWGTPVVPTSYSGPYAKNGVVSGSAVSTFDGSIIAPVTIDSRTLKTNYNVLNNSTGAEELWLRTGFEWAPTNDVTVKNQTYYYQAKRHWLDSETYAFNTTTNSTIDRDRFFVGHNQHLVGNNTDLSLDSNFAGMNNRFAAQLQASSNKITFTQHAGGFPEDTVDVINPDRGYYGVLEPDTRTKRLNTVAVSFEDRLKPTSWLALIGGIRFEHMTLNSDGVNFDGSIPAGQPFSTTWNPVSYRAAVTIEPVRNLMFYGMTATAYDPAAAGIFSVNPRNSLELTSSRIYEAGVKQLFWDNRAEWNLSAYNIARRNVYVQINTTTFELAGEVETKGIEFAAAVRPVDGLKLWGNVALTQARYKNFDFSGFTGNTPSNVAPQIINAGASYRWDHLRWPVEIGGSVRHVGRRFLFEDDATTMEAYTTADLYAFVDIPGRDFGRPELKNVRTAFRIRNLTNAVYAAFSDPGYQDQIYLGAPRTYEVSASFKW
jgi:iron complex outermembrane receptor protein